MAIYCYYGYMHIKSVKFIKSVVGEDKILEDGIPQIAFIGRSNVGKSSTINSLVKEKDLARVSSSPGRTQEINLYLVNKAFYLVDLPGYGYAKVSRDDRDWLHELINWYLFNEQYEQKKIMLIIDANIGPTKDDLEMLKVLEDRKKHVVVIANKIDKIKKSEYKKQAEKIIKTVGNHKVIFYSTKKGIGLGEVVNEMLM